MPTSASDQTTAYLLPQSVIPRTIAYLIDTAVVALLTAILMAAGVLPDSGLDTLDPDAIREMLQSNSGLAVYLILFAYFLICEGVWGRTAGKAALGMRVVKVQDGSPCGWARSIIRNLIRPLDLLFAGMPGAFVVMITPARQRIGDLLGGTLVVRQLKIPAAMAAVLPGLLRRCPDCGRLAPASAKCPACSASPPPPAVPAAAGQPFGAAMLQPLAGMMAAGEAAGALRVAAQEVLAAEAAYAEASAAESARMAREGSVGEAPEAEVEAAVEDAGAKAEAGAKADAGAAQAAFTPPEAEYSLAEASVEAESAEAEAFVATADAPGLSEDYVAAWRGLMAAVETLRARRADLDAKLATAGVPAGQLSAADPLLSGLLDQVEPYLDADDDEAVLAAFMARTSGAGESPQGDAAGAGDQPSA